ncbi:MAG: DNA internalization-related competence protein ComEC/Rec2 [Oscillospiraceae bacterium]|nr:DNA internalization-related competence protein ComEC/Rec2 [Oscillospiraceae bacterium]
MRKLATAALAFSAAIFLANYILPESWLIVPAVLSAVLGAFLALTRRKWLRPAVIALLFFSLGLMEYAIYERLTVKRAAEYAGETREIQGTVLDYPDLYESYNRLYIRISAGDMPRFKAIVYDNEKAFTTAEPGDHVSFTAKIRTADTLYGKPYDNYRTNGYYLRLSSKGNEILEKGGFSVLSLPARLRHLLCRRVDDHFPADCRAFIKALMLGDKQDFYADDALYVRMSRSGLMHVVAVSGLHISFLVGLLSLLFGNGRRGALFSIVLIWCFVLITGASNSAVRAAFMQTLLLLAPILRRENDSVTSLSAVLAIILAVCPFAAKSVSLQLSFSAMAGIVCFGEKIHSWLMRPIPEHLQIRPVRYALGVIASSLSVTVFTMPLTALHFSYVALLSVLSNIACIWAVSLCFCMAWIACALSIVQVLGTAAAWLCAWLARYILFCAGLVARIPYAVLYMRMDGAMLWMTASYALLLLGLLLRKKRFLRILLPAGLSLALLAGIILHTERKYRENDYFSILDVGQGQCITAFSGDAAAVIDCGNINNIEDAGTIAGEYLLGCGRKSVALLILTHLHADHADGAVRLMEMLPVDTLVLPADADDSGGLYAGILSCADRHGTRVVAVENNTTASVGGINARIYKPADDGDENERCLMLSIQNGDTELLVTADASKKQERALARREDVSDTDILIVGHHGSKYASSRELLEEAGGGLAVISVGYNTYGHPAKETLDALKRYGYQIMRTDEDGTVEIRLEREHG